MAAVLLVTASCGSPTSDGSGPAEVGTVSWQQQDLTFDHPADWTWVAVDANVRSKGFTVLGLLATVPIDVDRMCKGNAKRQKCNLRKYDLQPGTLVATITTGQSHASDVWQEEAPADATAMSAGGMPALLHEESDADGDLRLRWSIARPDAAGGWYEIAAELRGPGETAMRQQLDALVQSVAFDPPVELLPDDNRSLSDMAFEAMKELKADRQDGTAYSCFLDRPGVRPGVLDRIPGARPLVNKLPVSCSFRAEAPRWNVWRLSLRYSWAALGDRKAGSWLVTQWVAADGKLGAMSAGGDKVP
jgi:hypothetical protein